MARIGPVYLAIAFLARVGNAEFGLLLDHSPSMFSTTTDGIVDDDADGEHQRQQRDRIGRIADDQQHCKRADDGNRHGNQRISVVRSLPRNRKTTMPTRNEGDDERPHHLNNRRGDEHRRVKEHGVSEVGGKRVRALSWYREPVFATSTALDPGD